ncbi:MULTISPECIES: hypothetical protein [unclassified Mesorhizobium]|uniref:hypothetical protein n=1 Tax=unclassified Mesorhizobium TaxID=325217 RepID=UPI001CC94916|nr:MULTISPECIES: hypothetical protein [unclassified Mesorhizobium]MBZ9740082.1 hypothetical protein [Mesorhizobium sp. CO1-1-4]MBZ9803252.1 hypothetical protein [Mesorhizobium sp. ES1-6]MBZ9995732.1 hypothetical protein [Mesorhizobium sp. BH1-1-4]
MKKILLATALTLAAASAAIAPTQAATVVVKTNDHMHAKHCRTKVVTHWRHHHRVIEKVRVCN